MSASPLNRNRPIADTGGFPTAEFLRWAQDQRDLNAGIFPLETPAQVGAVLDNIGGGVQGAILYRGTSQWVALPPGSANALLATQGAGADPVWATVGAVLDALGGSAQGAVLYRGATGWALLPSGNAGDVLTTQGVGADPAWVEPAEAFVVDGNDIEGEGGLLFVDMEAF